MGYETTNLLYNASHVIFFIALYPVLIMLSYCVDRVPCVKQKEGLKNQMRYDFIFRLLIEVFLEIAITVFIQSKHFEFTTLSSSMGSYLNLIFFSMLIAFPLATLILISVN